MKERALQLAEDAVERAGSLNHLVKLLSDALKGRDVQLAQERAAAEREKVRQHALTRLLVLAVIVLAAGEAGVRFALAFLGR